MKRLFFLFLLFMLFMSCQDKSSRIDLIPKQSFEKVIDGKRVTLYTLKNTKGLVAQITNYGGRVVSLWIPDKHGDFEDIVLGYDNIEGYLKSNEKYFGALIGRYGNRIANGKFVLNDSTYTLATNNGSNHLHGGDKGFNEVVWDAHQVSDSILELNYLSRNGEEGYPGNLSVSVIYTLTDTNALTINYTARTDRATPINLTHHSFFNLHGAGKGTINDHILQIHASNYTPIEEGLIPTGEIARVLGTPFDFTKPKSIGSHVDSEDNQIKYGFGYDHNFVLDGSGLKLAATVLEPKSGRMMKVITNEPGLQFYGGNFLNGRDIGKGNSPYNYRTAFCLETQHFPDSPNQFNFPSTTLLPGAVYKSTCIYKFSIND